MPVTAPPRRRSARAAAPDPTSPERCPRRPPRPPAGAPCDALRAVAAASYEPVDAGHRAVQRQAVGRGRARHERVSTISTSASAGTNRTARVADGRQRLRDSSRSPVAGMRRPEHHAAVGVLLEADGEVPGGGVPAARSAPSSAAAPRRSQTSRCPPSGGRAGTAPAASSRPTPHAAHGHVVAVSSGSAPRPRPRGDTVRAPHLARSVTAPTPRRRGAAAPCLAADVDLDAEATRLLGPRPRRARRVDTARLDQVAAGQIVGQLRLGGLQVGARQHLAGRAVEVGRMLGDDERAERLAVQEERGAGGEVQLAVLADARAAMRRARAGAGRPEAGVPAGGGRRQPVALAQRPVRPRRAHCAASDVPMTPPPMIRTSATA